MFNIVQESMNARGLYWFKLGMDKLVDVTGSCQTQTLYLTQSVGVLENSSGEASYLLVQLFPFSLTIGPGLLGLGSWASVSLTWPGLLCLHHEGPASPQGYTVSRGIQLQGC